MRCPFCGFEESKVIDSRPTDEGERIRRRRECIKCAKRFSLDFRTKIWYTNDINKVTFGDVSSISIDRSVTNGKERSYNNK